MVWNEGGALCPSVENGCLCIRVNDAVAFDEQWAVGFLGSNRNIRIKCNLPGQEFPQCLLKEGLVVVIW